jgi:hypothetical protein
MAEMKQKMDVRTYSRYVEKGMIKDAEVQSFLKSLPDETDNAVWVDLTVEDAELGADSDDVEAAADEEVVAEVEESTPTHTPEGT